MSASKHQVIWAGVPAQIEEFEIKRFPNGTVRVDITARISDPHLKKGGIVREDYLLGGPKESSVPLPTPWIEGRKEMVSKSKIVYCVSVIDKDTEKCLGTTVVVAQDREGAIVKADREFGEDKQNLYFCATTIGEY